MKANILIVDDEESIRYTFNSFLSDEGHEVTTAGTYDEAIDKLLADDYDLVFMDIILGGKTGIDLLLNTRKNNIHCPVVMITGFPNAETASDAIRLGAFDYIFKPVRQETLLHTTNMALQYKAIQDENERYRSNLEAIFRSVKDAIITVNKELVVLEVNDAAKKICEIDRDCINKPVSSCLKCCNDKCIDILKKTISTNRANEVLHIECELKDKPKQVVSINASPLIDRHGVFSGAVMVIRDETRLCDLERNLREREQFHKIVGKSKNMQKVYSLIEDLADVQTTTLITGESGTGKELVAEAIHYKGKRNSRPLVKVNCSALSENLLESELFGHVKGAFTGADKDKTGRFQKADGGTIFLDEIGDISPRMQLRLLRVLQEKVLERVGDSSPVKIDVRVIAATNQNLTEKVKSGSFREDLYYRLKVVELSIPPLRERKEDIPLLVNYFLHYFNNRFNKNISAVSDDVQKIFMDYSWPGNVRELEHALEHAFVITRQSKITVDQLPRNFANIPLGDTDSITDKKNPGEKDILDALKSTDWNKAKAARILGMSRQTIYRKMHELGITDK
ncbi:MAG: sigma 54-interacting transcriptional regulator [Nitrospirota bacterium]